MPCHSHTKLLDTLVVPAYCLNWKTHLALSQFTGRLSISPSGLVFPVAANGKLHVLTYNY